MGMEQEIKLRAADADCLERLLAELCPAGDVESVRMHTTYFDTEDHLLASRKWVLRSRQENDDTVITLKTPADGNRLRGEWNLCNTDLLADGQASPHLYRVLFAQGAPQGILDLEGQPLRPVCGVRFLRRRCRLRIGNSVAELAVDLGTFHRGGRSAPLLEVELERVSGEFAPIEAFARDLAERFRLVEEPLSKFQQTMRL